MPLEGTPWGLAELHQPHPSENNTKKRTSLLWAHFPSPQSSQFRNPCKDPKTAGGDKSVRGGKAHLWCGWQGIRWQEGRDGKREKRKSALWDMSLRFSQLITHKADSLLSLLCSLIFHSILLTAPSACTTKVRWREWWHAHHTEIYYQQSHSPFMWTKWALEIIVYEDGPEQQSREEMAGKADPNGTTELLSWTRNTDWGRPLAWTSAYARRLLVNVRVEILPLSYFT